MFIKILFTIPLFILGFYLFLLSLQTEDIDKKKNPNLKKYNDLTGIVSYVSILFLISCIWYNNDSAYCKLDEDTYSETILSIEEYQYSFPEDAESILYCYFEDDGITYAEACEAFSEIYPYFLSTQELLYDIYGTLENNYIE